MGTSIEQESFGQADYATFSRRLHESLTILGEMLSDPQFGAGPASVGAELELYLVDEAGYTTWCNQAVLDVVDDPRFTLELNRYNIEFNASPGAARGAPFSRQVEEFEEGLAKLDKAAAKSDARATMIGILPTLRLQDIGHGAISDRPRYRAMAHALRSRRDCPFHVRIRGADELDIEADDLTMEGANTSFQMHLRVSPERYADTFNAIQVATAPALAVAGNAPFFLGKRLWQETRIALFKQAVDDRVLHIDDPWRMPARVSFGHGWLRKGALELFAENVALYYPIMPIMSDQDPVATWHRGEVPKLAELKLHNGTVWRWNRPVYDHHDGGHLRVELRALPAGPTSVDMLANAAFSIGLALGIEPHMEERLAAFPFAYANSNFYRAAQAGLDAELLWPTREAPSPRAFKARDLVLELLPIAHRGLLSLGVDADEANRFLGIIEKRATTGMTGARWQLQTLDRLLAGGMNQAEAECAMLNRYMVLSRQGAPVADWPVE